MSQQNRADGKINMALAHQSWLRVNSLLLHIVFKHSQLNNFCDNNGVSYATHFSSASFVAD